MPSSSFLGGDFASERQACNGSAVCVTRSMAPPSSGRPRAQGGGRPGDGEGDGGQVGFLTGFGSDFSKRVLVAGGPASVSECGLRLQI